MDRFFVACARRAPLCCDLKSVLWLAALCLCLSVASVSANDVNTSIGRVQFVAGSVSLNGQGADRNVAIHAGDVLMTGHDGFAHIKFIDGAFVSVRPDSKLLIHTYTYDPDVPKHNVVQFELKQGTARSITGKAGESNKPGFRFDTPAAAIGIRGTDFIASATDLQTRIRVFAGAIVALPGGCAETASCAGVEPAVLEASADTYLEFKSGEAPKFHRLIELPPGSPLHDAEDAEKAAENGAAEHAADVLPDIGEQSDSATRANDKLTDHAAPGPYRGPDQIVWGRWHDVRVMDGTPSVTVTEAMRGGKKVVLANNTLALLRTDVTRDVMSNWESDGQFDMKLADSQAFLRLGNTLYAAEVPTGSLTLDLNKNRFDTSLRVVYAEKGIDQTLHAMGHISDEGFIFSDGAQSDMNVKGVLSSEGDQAGYLFDKTLMEHVSLEGATLWSK